MHCELVVTSYMAPAGVSCVSISLQSCQPADTHTTVMLQRRSHCLCRWLMQTSAIRCDEDTYVFGDFGDPPSANMLLCLLPPQYKFIVDGDWKYDPNQPAMYDEIGNVNNVIEVQEYVPENLENVSGFDPPPSPPSRSARDCGIWSVSASNHMLS